MFPDPADWGSGALFYGRAVDDSILGTAQEYFNDWATTKFTSAGGLSETKFVAAYSDGDNFDAGTAIVVKAGGMPVGIAGAAATGGESVPVVIQGVSDNHAGLVPGATYYARPDGSVTGSKTPSFIGVAVSQSELLIRTESPSFGMF
ncbi:MAG: hypothetical protein ACYSYV_07625 [Planctomycetota bacterium]|jgi:hypothetical protein